MAALNFIDIIILIIFLCSVLVGFGRGFVSEMISIATLVAAFFVAAYFAQPLANYFMNSAWAQNLINQASSAVGTNTAQPASYAALAVSFGLLFAATVLLGSLVSSILNLAFQAGVLGIGNRLLGGIFGLVRGFIINLVLIFIVQLTPISGESWWQQSYFVNAFQPEVAWLGGIVSPVLANLKNKIGQTVTNMGNQLQQFTQ